VDENGAAELLRYFWWRKSVDQYASAACWRHAEIFLFKPHVSRCHPNLRIRDFLFLVSVVLGKWNKKYILLVSVA
jgi:hypothetical protein